MARNCFAPDCDSGYPSAIARIKALGKRNPSLFSAPKEPELLAKWQRAIPRKDKALAPPCKVCELHFDEECIVRSYKQTLADGSVFVYERGRPSLKPGSIPTKFPNLPKYLSSKTPKRKVNRKDFTEMTAKDRRVCSDHFVSVLGKPSKLRDINNPDWAPSLNLGYDEIQSGKSVLYTYSRLVNQAKKATDSTLIDNRRDNVQETSCDSIADSSSLSASFSNEEVIPVSNQISCALFRYQRLVNEAEKVTNSTLIENQRDNVQETSCDSMTDSSTSSASISSEEEGKNDEPDVEISDSSSRSSISPSERKSRNLNGIRNCSDFEKYSNVEDIEKTRKKKHVDCPSTQENIGMSEALSAQNNFDRESTFGQYVASELRALKDNRLLYIQTKQSILEVLTSAHLEYINPE